eukprot:gene554-698_t
MISNILRSTVQRISNYAITTGNQNIASISTTGLLVGTLNKSYQPQQPTTFYRNYVSKTKLEKIKSKREADAVKEMQERERKFIEVNKISIDSLTFPEAVLNVQDKFNKYGAVASKLVATLFKKASTPEQLLEALQFYRSINNTNPDYFKASQLQFIYYSFSRNRKIPLLAEILINSHLFQIFPRPNIVAKVYSKLVIQGENELAANLLLSYNNKYTVTHRFIELITKQMIYYKYLPLLHTALSFYPARLDIGSETLRYLLREGLKNGNVKEVLASLERHLPTDMDPVTQSLLLASRVVADPTSTQYENYERPQSDQKFKETLISNITRSFTEATPEGQQLIKDATSNNIFKDVQFQ